MVQLSTAFLLALICVLFHQSESASVVRQKRNSLSAFDTLGGIGLGKRSWRNYYYDDYDTGLEKRAHLSAFDTLGGIGLGKRSSDDEKRAALSAFDTLGGIGLGKRSSEGDKRAVSAFDSLGGIGLGKRSH